MLQAVNQTESRDLASTCQAVSQMMSLALPRPITTVGSAGTGSVRSTPRTKCGTDAFMNLAMRAAKGRYSAAPT